MISGILDIEIANRAKKSTRIYYAINKYFRENSIEGKLNGHNATIILILYANKNWVLHKINIKAE